MLSESSQVGRIRRGIGWGVFSRADPARWNRSGEHRPPRSVGVYYEVRWRHICVWMGGGCLQGQPVWFWWDL